MWGGEVIGAGGEEGVIVWGVREARRGRCIRRAGVGWCGLRAGDVKFVREGCQREGGQLGGEWRLGIS